MIVISGWCTGIGAAVRFIEALVDDSPHPVKWGLPRPDVASDHPGVAANDPCGFRLALALVPGPHEIVLRAVRDGASTVEFFRRRLDVGLCSLQGHVESPTNPVPAGPVHIAGWCFHSQVRLDKVALRVRGHKHDCRPLSARPDVARAFGDSPLAAQSGFEVEIDLPPGTHTVDLVGTLASGETLELAFPQRIRVSTASAIARGVERIRHRIRDRVAAGGGVIRMGRDWIIRRGHLPRLGDWPRLAGKAWRLLVERPPSGTRGLPGGFVVPPVSDRYDAWLAWNQWNERRARELGARLAAAAALPRISIVMPVYRPERKWLDRAIETVRAQVSDAWELCIADDASGDRALSEHLFSLAAIDSRIKVAQRVQNGNISHATNSAAELATGDFLLFLDQDDELAPDAIGEIALALAAAPDADILYSDDDKIDIDGRRYSPQFKSDASPERLLGYMYFSHALVVRRTLFESLGGFRAGFEGSQDYDFALRATERARRIVHVPLVLYHWRATPGSTASSGEAKPGSFDAGARAIDEALARRGSRGHAVRPPWAIDSKLGLYWHDFPDDGPRVAILIPAGNDPTALKRCLDSLARTTYRNLDIIVVDCESSAVRKYLARTSHRVLRIGNAGARRSLSRLHNEAARVVDADYLLFLNGNTEARDHAWLTRMMGYAQLPGVGAVGARLCHPEGHARHPDVLHGYYDGVLESALAQLPPGDSDHFSPANVVHNYISVTAACMLTPRRRFLDLGAFDEQRFAVAFFDVDYGYRLETAGLRCVYAPGAEIVLHDNPAWKFAEDPREAAAFRALHDGRHERWHNPNLALAADGFVTQPRRAFTAAPPGPVRALTCAFNLNWEGASNSQFEMVAELKRRGVLDPVVYSPDDGPLRAAYEGEGIPVHVTPHPLAGVMTTSDYDSALERFCAWIRSLDVQLVYGNTLQSFYAIDAAQRLGLPSVWNPRESEPWQDYFRQYPDCWAVRALACYAYPYRIVFVSHATAAGSAAIDTRHNFTVIHNGLDRRRLLAAARGIDREGARRSLGIGSDDIVLLLVGTVCDRKGQHDLARALALVPRAAAARVRTYFVGDRASSYSRTLHDLVAKLPDALRERTTVVAETGDVARYFVAADVFVCTSRVESYPRVILEAMAHGLPIITTPVFGVREQVRENVNGVFYPPGDVKALGTAIAGLVADDALRQRLAANALPVLDSLIDFDTMVTQYGRIFIEAAAA